MPDDDIDPLETLRGGVSHNGSDSTGLEHERLLNDEIIQDMMYPSEHTDFDYGFLISR